LGPMKPSDADNLTRLREWARNPLASSAPMEVVAGWVMLLFRRCSELADMTPRFLEMQEEVRSTEAQIRCYQKELVRLRALLNALTKAPWEQGG